jgi:hypothetical protein
MNDIDISAIIILLFIIITMVTLYLKKILKDDPLKTKINDILNKENFIVADAQDFHNYDKLRENVKKQDDNFNKERIANPPIDNIVNYDAEKDNNEYKIAVVHGEPKRIPEKTHEKSFITAVDFGWEAPFPVVSCSNSSINDRTKTGPKKMMPYQIGCGFPNKLTAENFYKTHYQATPIPLEDYVVRGANYMEYSDFPHPVKSNIRILSQNTKGLPPEQTKYKNVPSGYNYAFHNTPAMRMV